MTVMIDLEKDINPNKTEKSYSPMHRLKLKIRKTTDNNKTKNHIKTIGMAIQRGNSSCILETV